MPYMEIVSVCCEIYRTLISVWEKIQFLMLKACGGSVFRTITVNWS
jgi:hypothetical protein